MITITLDIPHVGEDGAHSLICSVATSGMEPEEAQGCYDLSRIIVHALLEAAAAELTRAINIRDRVDGDETEPEVRLSIYLTEGLRAWAEVQEKKLVQEINPNQAKMEA